jgi:hypothetical protein
MIKPVHGIYRRTDEHRPVPAAPERVRDPRRGARLRVPNRDQIEWGRIDLEAQLPEAHPARGIWAVIERLELSALYTPIEARDEVAGAPAIDPKLLLALWVYATSEGEGSAREIWRLTTMHAAHRWLCGRVEIGYHTAPDSGAARRPREVPDGGWRLRAARCHRPGHRTAG